MTFETKILNTKYFPSGSKEEEESLVMINNELLYKNEVWHENGIRAVEEFRSSYQSYMNNSSKLTNNIATSVLKFFILICFNVITNLIKSLEFSKFIS